MAARRVIFVNMRCSAICDAQNARVASGRAQARRHEQAQEGPAGSESPPPSKLMNQEGSRPETATGASVTGASSGQTFTGYTRAGALAYLGQQLELQDQQLEDSQQLVTELTVKSRVLNRVPEPLRSLCVLADAESSDEMVAGAWARLQVSLIALAGQSDDIGLLDAPAIGQSIEIEREKWDAVLRQWREAPEYLKRIHGGPVDGGGSGPDSGVVSWLARQSADSFQDRYDRQTVELLLRAAIVHRKAKSYIQGGFDDHEAAALLGPCLEISRSGPVQWPSNAIGLAKSPQQQRMIGCASLWLPSLGETGKGAENGVWVAYDIAPALQMVRVYHFISRLPATDEDLAMTVRDRRHVRQVRLDFFVLK